MFPLSSIVLIKNSSFCFRPNPNLYGTIRNIRCFLSSCSKKIILWKNSSFSTTRRISTTTTRALSKASSLSSTRRTRDVTRHRTWSIRWTACRPITRTTRAPPTCPISPWTKYSSRTRTTTSPTLSSSTRPTHCFFFNNHSRPIPASKPISRHRPRTPQCLLRPRLSPPRRPRPPATPTPTSVTPFSHTINFFFFKIFIKKNIFFFIFFRNFIKKKYFFFLFFFEFLLKKNIFFLFFFKILLKKNIFFFQNFY